MKKYLVVITILITLSHLPVKGMIFWLGYKTVKYVTDNTNLSDDNDFSSNDFTPKNYPPREKGIDVPLFDGDVHKKDKLSQGTPLKNPNKN